MKAKILFLPLIAACLLIVQSCCKNGCLFETVDLRGSITKTSIHGDDSWQDPLGFQIGADCPVIHFNNALGIRAGAMISLQGAGWKEFDLEGRTNLWYAYLPVVVRYQHSSGFYGEAGVQPGFLISAQDKYEGTTESYMDHMNKFDLSIPAAIGYKFKNNLGVNLSVIPGIIDITKDEDVKDVNFVMGIGLTYTFDFKK